MINWICFPLSEKPPELAFQIADVFQKSSIDIDSGTHVKQDSDEVLAKVRDGLEILGFRVEFGKKKIEKIHVPVLFGQNGKATKSFEADAYHAGERFVLEVEAGRGVTNYQFLKDLFQACMMDNVEYLAIAVRNNYRGSDDYGKVQTFFETLYASQRLKLPLKGVMVIGY